MLEDVLDSGVSLKMGICFDTSDRVGGRDEKIPVYTETSKGICQVCLGFIIRS